MSMKMIYELRLLINEKITDNSLLNHQSLVPIRAKFCWGAL